MGDGRKSWSELCQTQIPESPRRLVVGVGGTGCCIGVSGESCLRLLIVLIGVRQSFKATSILV